MYINNYSKETVQNLVRVYKDFNNKTGRVAIMCDVWDGFNLIQNGERLTLDEVINAIQNGKQIVLVF